MNKKSANSQSENQKTENELLLEALGGWKNGRVYGLGNATENYFSKPHRDPSAKKARNDLVTNLENQIQDLTSKNLEQAKELEETKAGLTAATTKLNETNTTLNAIQAQVQFLSQAWSDRCNSSMGNLRLTPATTSFAT